MRRSFRNTPSPCSSYKGVCPHRLVVFQDCRMRGASSQSGGALVGMYRLLLVRGIAWALEEKPEAFMPIVFDGITDEKGMVGTKDTMMNYRNRKK